MEKLDVKDRKILYELDLDSRQSFSQLGKKVGLHKDVVAYRVKNLQEKGILKYFSTKINEFKLGYFIFRFYLSFQYAIPEVKKEIIDYLIKYEYSKVVHSLEGQYDLCIFLKVKDLSKLYQIWRNFFNKYRNFFTNQVLSFFCEQIEYPNTFLLVELQAIVDYKKNRTYWQIEKRVDTDDFNIKLLKLIENNSRMSTIELARKLNSSVGTINSRIKNLIKKGVILGFNLQIDYTKIGYKVYKTDIYLKEPDKYEEILKFVESNPNLKLIIKTLGYADFEINFLLQNVDELHEIMDELFKKFPNAIRNYSYFSITKTHKYESILE